MFGRANHTMSISEKASLWPPAKASDLPSKSITLRKSPFALSKVCRFNLALRVENGKPIAVSDETEGIRLRKSLLITRRSLFTWNKSETLMPEATCETDVEDTFDSNLTMTRRSFVAALRMAIRAVKLMPNMLDSLFGLSTASTTDNLEIIIPEPRRVMVSVVFDYANRRANTYVLEKGVWLHIK